MASYNDTSGETEMVEGDVNNLNADHAEQLEGEQRPCFPHLQLDRRELDKEYPSLEAPSDFDTPHGEPAEPTLQAGLKVASSIATAMRVHGRTRRDKA